MIKRIVRRKDLNEDEKCAKHQEELARRKNAIKKKESDEISKPENILDSEEPQKNEEENLPFQDILADQRRKYTAKEEFVNLIYNDLFKFFVKERKGTYLRKTAIPTQLADEPTEENMKKITNVASKEDIVTIDENKKSILYPKLNVPDENVEITFVNGNSYTGRLSRQKMEGEGVFRWRNGTQYKGEFEDNEIQGKGKLDWQDKGWYEGDFHDGYRHGKGTMVDNNYNLLYIGQWHKGHKHGKGYCRYESGDSFDGDWIKDRPEGVGKRIYPSGARYIGHWKDGFRHGIGTMAWPNGDIYRGEWKLGVMHGYGEYTWNGFFNKTLCWPQEVSYMGGWYEGTRNGRGQLSLNTIGGARYSGEWKKNKKHGYGTIIGNNGEVTEGDPLFENDILLPLPIKNPSESKDLENIKNAEGKNSPKSVSKPSKIAEARTTTVLIPEQCIPLWYYIDRLRETETTLSSSSSSSLASLTSEKCRQCENEPSCRCLRQLNDRTYNDKASQLRLSRSSSLDGISTVLSNREKGKSSAMKPTKKLCTSEFSNFEQEEYWTRNCITMHMSRIRKIYDIYTKIFCDSPPNCRLSMSKLSLWQLWRDCGIHKKISLVQIDYFLAANKLTMTEDPHCPFERVEIWQLIHAFLEVSWHIYTKNDDIDAESYPGRLGNGLNKFLLQDIYPNYEKSTGVLVSSERDLLPLYPVYQLYLSIGKVHSARQLFKTIFLKKGENESKLINRTIAEFFPEGKNAVTVGEKLSYLSSSDKPLLDSKPIPAEQKANVCEHSLSALRDLGAEDFIQIMSSICPIIKDPETELIINIEYQLTFLEFLEIFVEAGKKLVLKRKIKVEADRIKAESAMDAVSIVSSAKGRKNSRSIVRLSSGIKSTKARKKVSAKH